MINFILYILLILPIFSIHSQDYSLSQDQQEIYNNTLEQKYTKYGKWENVSAKDKAIILQIISEDPINADYIELVLFAYNLHLKNNPRETFSKTDVEAARPAFHS